MQPRRRALSSWVCRALAATALTGCAAAPTTPIVFAEVTDDRVPSIGQTAFLDTNQFFGPGAAIGDVDGDGRPDLYLSGSGLYLNRPDPAGFRLQAAPGAMPPVDIQPIGVAFSDFDRDGDLDLALVGQGGVRLFQNDGTGRFTDVTATAGIAGPPADLSVSVAWGDLDGDGYPDLAVGNYGVVFDPMRDEQPSHIYLNQRDGTFQELLAPLSDPALTVRATIASFADFDGDGRLDVYFSDDREVYFLDKQKPRHDLVLLNRGLDASGAPILVESSAALGLGDPHATM
ncbi:MAG: FG-GAP repeat domain-containing protein, partial [Polyangia bacterium]